MATEKWPKLPKAFKTKWVKALRSGDFKQGQAELKTRGENPRYCCLGVAAEIVGCKKIEGCGAITKGNGIKGISKVPKGILGGYNNPLSATLIKMNDNQSKSFFRNSRLD